MQQHIAIFRFSPNEPPDPAMLASIERLSLALREIPGFQSHSDFFGSNGEVLTFVEFNSVEALNEWRNHPLHREAKNAAHKTMKSWRVWIGSVAETYDSSDFGARKSSKDEPR